MKISLRFLLLPLLAVFMAACGRKEVPTTLHGYFYTPDVSMGKESPVHLIMDGVDKGVLPYISGVSKDSVLKPADSVLRATSLQFDFPSGEHKLEARSADGTVLVSTQMYVRFYKDGASSGSGPGEGGNGGYLDGNTKQYVGYLFR